MKSLFIFCLLSVICIINSLNAENLVLQLANKLKNSPAIAINYNTNASKLYPKNMLDTFSQEIFNCGLPYGRIACLESEFKIVAFENFIQNKKIIVLQQLMFTNGDRFLLKIEGTPQGNIKAELYSCGRIKLNNMQKTLAAKSTLQIAKIKLADEPYLHAVRSLNEIDNYLQCYHLCRKVLQEDLGQTKKIKRILSEKAKLFLLDQNGDYQLALLFWLRNYFADDAILLESFATMFLSANNSNVQLLAAIILAEHKANNAQVLQLVRNGLQNKTLIFRLLSIQALAIIHEGLKDDKLLIEMLADPSGKVRKEACRLLLKNGVTEKHFPTICLQTTSKLPETRILTLHLLDRYNNQITISKMINMVLDDKPAVSNLATYYLQKKQLTTKRLPKLKNMLEKSTPQIKINTLKLIASIKNTKALQILLSQATNANKKVAKIVKELLQHWQTAISDLPILRKEIKSNSAKKREIVLCLLGKLDMDLSRMLLINALTDINKTVASYAFQLLKQMKITKEDIITLKELAKEDYPLVRLRTLELLAKIKDDQVKKLIIPMIGDTNKIIAKRASVLIKQYKLNDDDLKNIKPLLSNTLPIIRNRAILLLSHLKFSQTKQQLFQMLNDQNLKIRTQILNYLLKQKYTEKDFKLIKTLQNSKYLAVRITAINLITKIDSPLTVNNLLTTLNDSSVNVRNFAILKLKNYKITEKQLSTIDNVLKNKNENIRLIALQYLQNIPNDACTKLLMKILINDKNIQIVTTVGNILERRPIHKKYLPLIQYLLNKKDINKKIIAVRITGHITANEAKNMLTQYFEIEKNRAVRHEITIACKKINLALQKQLDEKEK